MAMPSNTLSSVPMTAPYTTSKRFSSRLSPRYRKEVDYDEGGVDLNDPSEGLLSYKWSSEVVNRSEVVIRQIGGPEYVVYTAPPGSEITECSFTFNQNMDPHLGFVEDGEAKLYWFDSAVGDMVVTNYGSEVKDPRVVLDFRDPVFSEVSDVLFFYSRNGKLCHRKQGDRFLVEYELMDIEDDRLDIAAISSGNRVQIRLRRLP